MNIVTNPKMKSVNIKYIEELFTDLMMKDDVVKTLGSLKKILNTEFNGAICDDIIIGENQESFYGMGVYPSTQSTKELAMAMSVENSTKEFTKKLINMKMHYTIEIDPKLLYDKILNFNPDEVVAILLHEIGHVVADTDFYNDLMVSYNTAIYNATKDKSTLLGKSLSEEDIQLAMLYIISAINSTNINNRSDYGKVLLGEQIADKFVVNQGYGEALVKAMDKTTKFYLNKFKKISTERKIKNDADAIAHMAKMFSSRRKYVLSLIDDEIKTTPIKSIKTALKGIKDRLKNIIIHENTNMLELNEAAGFISKFMSSPTKITQLDIDELTIEKEMMEDWDDKSILVYKIHKRITQLESAKKSDKIKDDKYYIKIIEGYITQLNKLLNEVMKFKEVKKSYGVFIKYPKGYED